MPQLAKLVDLTRSAVITDPDSFLQNLGYSAAEDNPEKTPPIVCFEGYNFLPTSYGYRSYFGTNSNLDIDALTSRCDEVLMYQFGNYKNILIALCEDGIWVARPTATSNNWTQSVSMSVPSVGTYKNYSHCIIENRLYIYRQGESTVKYLTSTSINGSDVVTFSTLTPTFLNMAGQMGIFRANGRIGFWDSANSVSWSSLLSLSDFTPSLETLAGNAIFNGILGRIVRIIQQGDGFVIYATKSIVGVRYTTSNLNVIWEASQITDTSGIDYPSQVTRGITDLEHFAYTSSGIKKIGTYNALNRSHGMEEVLTEVFDFLKESNELLALKILNGRFLCFLTVDDTYIDGRTIFSHSVVDSFPIQISGPEEYAGLVIADITIAGQTISSHVAEIVGEFAGTTWVEMTGGFTVASVPGTGTGTWTESSTDADGVQYGTLVVPGDPSQYYLGQYISWQATGSCTVPARTTAINPYNLDSSSNHVDNTPLDLTSKISAGVAQGYVSSGSYSDASFSVAPFAKTLGWTFAGLGRVSAANLGVTSGYLNEFVITQNEEWTNFTTIQTATRAAFLATTPEVSTVQGGATYWDTAIAAAAMETLILAEVAGHAGATRAANVVTWYEDIGTLLSGSGITTGPTISGAGTSGATMSLSRALSGGYRIKRKVDKSFAVAQSGAPVNTYNRRLAINGTSGDFSPNLGVVNFTDITPVGCVAEYVSTISHAAAFTRTLTQGIQQSKYYIPLGITVIPFEFGIDVIRYSGDGGGPGITAYDTGYSYEATRTPYRIDTSTTKTITSTNDAGLTGSSSASASQMIINWGYSLGGTPPSSEQYSYSIPGTFHPATEGGTNGYFYPSGSPSVTSGWNPGLAYGVAGADTTFSYPAVTVPGISYPSGYKAADINITYPSATFFLQDGTIAPIYPTYSGFLCLDLFLKKWGKARSDFKALVDYVPANDSTTATNVSNLGMEAGILNASGVFYLFDSLPTASMMRFGKFGMHRLGYTSLEEVRVHFRNSSTGAITVESSIDGSAILEDLSVTQTFTSASIITWTSSISARWHTVVIEGKFDLQYMAFIATMSSRR